MANFDINKIVMESITDLESTLTEASYDPTSLKDSIRHGANKVKSVVSSAKEKVSDSSGSAGDKVKSAIRNTQDKVHAKGDEVGDKIQSSARDARRKIADAIAPKDDASIAQPGITRRAVSAVRKAAEENPKAALAAGAIGAGVGSVMIAKKLRNKFRKK